MFKSKIESLNQAKWVHIVGLAGIFYICVLLIFIFVKYFEIKYNLTNPLLPKYLVDYAFQTHALKGLILSIGLPIILLAKFAKHHFLVLVLVVATLLAYVFTDHSIELPFSFAMSAQQRLEFTLDQGIFICVENQYI